jgi:hypothetical protein
MWSLCDIRPCERWEFAEKSLWVGGGARPSALPRGPRHAWRPEAARGNPRIRVSALSRRASPEIVSS